MIYNRISIALGGLTKVKGPAINYQYDQKQILILSGLELPDYYTVDFCNDGDSQTMPIVGTADGVEIPDEYLATGRPVKAYLVVTGEDEGAVETRYEITLPVNQRPARTDITPTPAEQSTIDGLIEAMNQAVTDTEEAAEQAGQAVLHYPKVVNEYWYVWDVTAEDYVNTGYKATGSGTGISDAYLNADYTLTIEFTDGTSYTTPSIRGEPGPVGATPDFDIGTVTTGQPGTPASATITGTAANPLLNLTIPKGDPGEVTQSEFDTAIGTINSALSSLSSVTEIIDTASGTIASFPDGSGLPMRSLVAEINPVQDLHGQPNPYPAGGGKNKLDYDTVYAQFKVGENNFQGDSQTIAGIFIYIPESLVGQALTFSAYVDLTGLELPSAYLVQANVSGSNINGNAIVHGNTGYTEVTFTPTSTSDYIKFTWGSGNDTIKIKDIQLEIGSSRTTWTPYSNICPISGHTGVEVMRTGRNLLDNTDISSTSSWTAIGSDKWAKDLIGIKIGETYTINAKATSSLSGSYLYLQKKVNGEFVTSQSLWQNSLSNVPYTFVADSNEYRLWAYNPTASINLIDWMQLELGSTANTYEEYTGEAISVSFGRTVYGGTDEVIGGHGTSTMGMVDLGTLNWTYGNGKFASTGIMGIVKAPSSGVYVAKILCSAYKPASAVDTDTINNTVAITGSGRVNVRDNAYSDADTFKAAVSGVQLCYELATPQSFTHDGQEVDTLVGQNNVWVDTGSVEVTYPADTKLYIDKKIAELAT